MKNYPHVSSQTLCIVGTNLPVRRLWGWFARGIPVETLFKRYPQIERAKILSALAFAHDNLTEIEEDIAKQHAKELEAARDPRQLALPDLNGRSSS